VETEQYEASHEENKNLITGLRRGGKKRLFLCHHKNQKDAIPTTIGRKEKRKGSAEWMKEGGERPTTGVTTGRGRPPFERGSEPSEDTIGDCWKGKRMKGSMIRKPGRMNRSAYIVKNKWKPGY